MQNTQMIYEPSLADPACAVSSATDCHSGGREFAPQLDHITFVKIGHEIISTDILSLSLFQVVVCKLNNVHLLMN